MVSSIKDNYGWITDGTVFSAHKDLSANSDEALIPNDVAYLLRERMEARAGLEPTNDGFAISPA